MNECAIVKFADGKWGARWAGKYLDNEHPESYSWPLEQREFDEWCKVDTESMARSLIDQYKEHMDVRAIVEEIPVE